MAKTAPKWISELVDKLCMLPAQDLTSLVGATVIRNEIGAAVERYSKSEDHGRRMVARIVNDCRWRPTVAEIIEASKQTPLEAPSMQAASSSCSKCNGLGFEIEIRATWLRERAGREPIPCGKRFDTELDAWDYIRDLQAPDLQYTGDVVSGAKECACRRVAA